MISTRQKVQAYDCHKAETKEFDNKRWLMHKSKSHKLHLWIFVKAYVLYLFQSCHGYCNRFSFPCVVKQLRTCSCIRLQGSAFVVLALCLHCRGCLNTDWFVAIETTVICCKDHSRQHSNQTFELKQGGTVCMLLVLDALLLLKCKNQHVVIILNDVVLITLNILLFEAWKINISNKTAILTMRLRVCVWCQVTTINCIEKK